MQQVMGTTVVAGLEPIVLAIRKAFPDLHYEIRDSIATTIRWSCGDQINIERIPMDASPNTGGSPTNSA